MTAFGGMTHALTVLGKNRKMKNYTGYSKEDATIKIVNLQEMIGAR